MAAASKTQREIQHNKCISKLFSSMTKVHEVNRQCDHQLTVRVEELRQKEHMESVKRYSDMRFLQRTLSEMRMEKSRLTHTFTPEEIDNDEVAPVMSWRKIQLKRFQNQPRVRQRRKSESAQALLAVAENAEFTAKNKFRSAIMAVCFSKALSKIPENGRKSEEKTKELEQTEKEKSNSTMNDVGEHGKRENDMKATTINQMSDKLNNSGETENDTEKKEQARPDTSETERLSHVLDVLRNSSRDSWAVSPMKKCNVVPMFGQLHPARRSSLSRRPGDPRRRRPSTSDMNTSHFVMDKDGTVRRLSKPTAKEVDTESSRGERTRSSSNPGSRKGTPSTPSICKVYAAEPSRWNVLKDPSAPKNDATSSFFMKKRGELLKRDREMMDRLRRFLDSTMP